MTGRRGVVGQTCPLLQALALGLMLASCNDDTTTDNTPTTTTTAPPSSAIAFLRSAPLAFDAHTVDVVVSGANGSGTFSAISYPEVSDYLDLPPGEYRVQFFPAGSRNTAVAETSVTLSDGQSVTVALVGLSAFEVTVFEDDRNGDSSRAGLAMVNTIPDFPAPLDAVILNGPTLFQNVGYLETTGATGLVPGRYDFELRRAAQTNRWWRPWGDLAAGAAHDFRRRKLEAG
jgi:hypothetical protein